MNKPDSKKSFPVSNIPGFGSAAIPGDGVEAGTCSETAREKSGSPLTCPEISTFRSILEKLTCVNQEEFTWTWDHETETFLIQATDHVIGQYVDILSREMGKTLCLPLKRASLTVDLRPWKSDAGKTSLRIGFEGSHIPSDLQGHTGLDDLVNLHFISLPEDPPHIKNTLQDFKLICSRVDHILGRKYEWMWEKHWANDGLAFAIVRALTWLKNQSRVTREIETFNNLPGNKQSGSRIDFSTYCRGTSFNVRIALNGLPNNLKKNICVLDVFDAHYSGP